MVYLLFGVFLGCLAVGFPVAFSLGLSSLVYLLFSDIPLYIIPQKMFNGIDSFVLLCLPGFIMAGNLMNSGGITERIVGFANSVIGQFRGGLSHANIIASMIFAGISGTAVADCASIGAVMIPSMRKQGYTAPYSSALTAAASTMGPIIPPSLPMIIAGTLTGLSVAKLFVAGAIPGLMIGLGQMVIAAVIARRRGHPKGRRHTWAERWLAFKNAFFALILPAIILVGILGGIFTPTEASVVAALYAMVAGMFIYKGLKPRDLPQVILDSLLTTASLVVLIGLASLFAWILTSEQIPQLVADGLLRITRDKHLIFLMINLLLLFVGTFMETVAALVILFPVLLNVATAVGIDPIHFGLVAVFNLVIGLLTPPVGVCLFVAQAIGGVTLDEIVKSIWPFLLWSITVLLLVTYIPSLVLFLPGFVYK